MSGYVEQAGGMEAARAVEPRGPASVRRDIAEMWYFARKTGIARELRGLHHPSPSRSILAALTDWLLIGLAAAATSVLGWIAVPFSLLVIGNRQRALGNLLHDASHRSLDSNRNRARTVANVLFCWPLWVSLPVYRDEHNRHHKYLGDPARDPDFIHDETRLPEGWRAVWLAQIRSPQALRAALLGHLRRMDAPMLAGVACWWGAALALISLAAGAQHAAILFALWITARVLVFHPITMFREISDHVGLHPGTLIGFSRNHPFGSVLGQIFHPHHNGYHLLHHLTPGMPFHALPRAHALLMRWPRYAAGEHCDSYFSGRLSAVRSWVSRWVPTTR